MIVIATERSIEKVLAAVDFKRQLTGNYDNSDNLTP